MELENSPYILYFVLLVVLVFAVIFSFFIFVSKARLYNGYSISND